MSRSEDSTLARLDLVPFGAPLYRVQQHKQPSQPTQLAARLETLEGGEDSRVQAMLERAMATTR